METQILQPRIKRIEKVWVPDAEIEIPHEDGYVKFAYPSFGPDSYLNTGKQILEHGLMVPTGDQIASLIHSAYCSDLKDNPEFENIRDIMRTKWFWVFNRNLWTSEGVYVVQDKEVKGRSGDLSTNDLENLLKEREEINGVMFNKSGSVRFAPKDSYKLEYNSPEELSQKGFVIASYGVEGAEKLAEVSRKFPNKPYVYGLDIKEDDKIEQRISALYDSSCGRLSIDGDFGGGTIGHAFGVLK